MGELGATRIKPGACADEATGLEDVVEPWTRTILIEITNACRGGAEPPNTVTKSTMGRQQTKKAEEEKKEMDVPPASTPSSTGVQIVKALLCCKNKALPTVEHSSLPPLGTSF